MSAPIRRRSRRSDPRALLAASLAFQAPAPKPETAPVQHGEPQGEPVDSVRNLGIGETGDAPTGRLRGRKGCPRE